MVDPTKIETIRDWARPTSPSKACNFIGLVCYYSWFVQGFAAVAMPMTRLT